MRGVLYAGSPGSTIGQGTQGTLGRKFTPAVFDPQTDPTGWVRAAALTISVWNGNPCIKQCCGTGVEVV